MPDDLKQSWKRFVDGIRSLFSDLPEYRHQDQFLAAHNAALDLAASDEMANDFAAAYNSPNVPEKRPLNIVLLKLDAFPLAISVYQAEVKSGTVKAGAKSQLCSVAKTILGSVGELFSLTPFGKGVVCVLKEGVEIFG